MMSRRGRACRATVARCAKRQASVGRCHKRGAAVVAAGDHQSGGDIDIVVAPKEFEISFKYRPETDAGLQPVIIE